MTLLSGLIWIGMYLWFPVSMFDSHKLGSTITTIAGSDTLSNSRSTINTNFSNLNTDKFELSDWYATTTANHLTDIGNQTSFSITYASTTNFDATTYLKVGTNGSFFAELKATTCNLTGMDISHPATSTQNYGCAVTGVASGDVVMAQLSTTTIMYGGWAIQGAIASTTSGQIDVAVINLTGAAATPSSFRVGSSTNVWYGDI